MKCPELEYQIFLLGAVICRVKRERNRLTERCAALEAQLAAQLTAPCESASFAAGRVPGGST